MRNLLGIRVINLEDNNKCKYVIDITGRIMLTLPTGTRRIIGQLYDTGDGLFYGTVRQESIHLFRKTNSYGFNDFIYKTFKPDKVIIWVEDKQIRLSATASVIDNKAEYLHFKNQGFELQKFLQLHYFKEELPDT